MRWTFCIAFQLVWIVYLILKKHFHPNTFMKTCSSEVQIHLKKDLCNHIMSGFASIFKSYCPLVEPFHFIIWVSNK
jgi:hypothetical protein